MPLSCENTWPLPPSPERDRISPGLTVGAGLLSNDVAVECTAHFNIRQYVVFEAEDAMGISEIDYDFTEAGVPGTLPTAVMNEILAEKAAAGVGGALTGRRLVEYGPLPVDPTVDLSTPQPEGFIVIDEETGAVTESQNFPVLDIHLVMGDKTVVIRPGDRRIMEAPGRDNLATADGPGEMDLFPGGMFPLFGKCYRPIELQVNLTAARQTTPPTSFGGTSSWDFEFDARRSPRRRHDRYARRHCGRTR